MENKQTYSKNDILCGRSRAHNRHPGNTFFHDLVLRNKNNYSKGCKSEKTKIALSLIEDIRNQHPPGRFLKQNVKTGAWSEIGDKKAIGKVKQALRDAISYDEVKKIHSENLFIPYIPLETEHSDNNASKEKDLQKFNEKNQRNKNFKAEKEDIIDFKALIKSSPSSIVSDYSCSSLNSSNSSMPNFIETNQPNKNGIVAVDNFENSNEALNSIFRASITSDYTHSSFNSSIENCSITRFASQKNERIRDYATLNFRRKDSLNEAHQLVNETTFHSNESRRNKIKISSSIQTSEIKLETDCPIIRPYDPEKSNEHHTQWKYGADTFENDLTANLSDDDLLLKLFEMDLDNDLMMSDKEIKLRKIFLISSLFNAVMCTLVKIGIISEL